jgi:hypothetical protein
MNSTTRTTCHVERPLDLIERHRCSACGGVYLGEGSYVLHRCVAGSIPSPLPGPVPVRLEAMWARMADQGRAIAFDLARRYGLADVSASFVAGAEMRPGDVVTVGSDGRLVPATAGATPVGTVVSASGRSGTIRLGGWPSGPRGPRVR